MLEALALLALFLLFRRPFLKVLAFFLRVCLFCLSVIFLLALRPERRGRRGF